MLEGGSADWIYNRFKHLELKSTGVEFYYCQQLNVNSLAGVVGQDRKSTCRYQSKVDRSLGYEIVASVLFSLSWRAREK